jgi:undecaprenyl-diphosphatase
MLLTETPGAGRGRAAHFVHHITLREVLLMRRLCDLRRFPLLTTLFVAASRLGDGTLWWGSGLLLLALGDGGMRWAVAGAALAHGLATALFTALKRLIGRPRPFESWCDLPCLLAPPDRFSFPSGHTMNAFAACANYALLIPGSELVFLPAAVLIGISRVFLGCHYPTDVLVGALLGTGLGWVTAQMVLAGATTLG